MAAQASYSSCEQYRENVRDARRSCGDAGLADVEVTYVPGWHAHEGFIAANAEHVATRLDRAARSTLRAAARLIFTAHSIPLRMAERSRYREQLRRFGARGRRAVGIATGRSSIRAAVAARRIPWLGPDVCDYLARLEDGGLASGGPVPDWLRLRSHRGPLRSRSRSRGVCASNSVLR